MKQAPGIRVHARHARNRRKSGHEIERISSKHIDTFDPKENKWAGRLIDAIGFGDNLASMKRPVIPCLRTFTRYGKSGIPVSDWFPHVGSVIDDIAVVRSMWCHEGNHFPAVIETSTGQRGRQFDHPTFGSWVS